MTPDEIVSAIDDAIHHLEATTVTYPRWQSLFDQGKYKDPSKTEWGAAFADLKTVRDGLSAQKPPAFSWGFSSHVARVSNPDAYVASLANAGSKALRDEISWSFAERTKGTYDFSRADLICNLARKYGQKVVAQFNYSPSWANGGKQEHVGPFDVSYFAKYAASCGVYLQQHHADVVEAIEPWNEPNGSFLINPTTGASGDVAYYVKLFNAAYDAIKAANVSIPVWAGALAGVGKRVWNNPTCDWLEDALKLEMKGDALSVHPYNFKTGWTGAQMVQTSSHSPWADVFWVGETVRQLLDRYGKNSWLIHGTESGCPTDAYPSGTRIDAGGFGTTSESEQANWFSLGYPLWRKQAGLGAGWLFVYTGWDDNSSDTTDRENHFGGFHSDGSPKLIVAKMKSATA